MKAKGLVLFILISLTVRVSSAQFIRFPTDPLLPHEQAMVDAPTTKIKCVNLGLLDSELVLKEQDQRVTMLDVANCNSRGNFVLEKDFNIISAQKLKPVCPEVKFKNPEPHRKGSTIEMYPDLANRPDPLLDKGLLLLENDPYRITLEASCYFKAKDGRKIKVERYHRKCRMTDLKESGMSVTDMWQENKTNYQKIGDCFNSEKQEMLSSEAFIKRNTPSTKTNGSGGR